MRKYCTAQYKTWADFSLFRSQWRYLMEEKTNAMHELRICWIYLPIETFKERLTSFKLLPVTMCTPIDEIRMRELALFKSCIKLDSLAKSFDCAHYSFSSSMEPPLCTISTLSPISCPSTAASSSAVAFSNSAWKGLSRKV